MPQPFLRQAGTLALTGLACILAASAQAQVSGSAGVVSDYMYRGISLSSGKPAARLSIDVDGAQGWFAGGQVVSGQLAPQSHRNAQWLGYAGYAERLQSGWSWEAGLSAYAFHAAPDWNFREVFVGMAFENYSARLHYSPDYLGFRERTLYAELNGGAALAAGWRYFWRGGYLAAPGNADSSRAEGRVGIGTGFEGWQMQLSLDAVRRRGRVAGTGTGYGSSASETSSKVHSKLVLGLARSF
ncbi:TorF family putative porin [Duganella sp. CF458]|uniref:TorF family putative porin n=1 Tax=Duganella sp. CF458 TaxID=1884368 RepID=UPI00147EC73E|nr:TorF family putative porin [Duganella sp. CF458]